MLKHFPRLPFLLSETYAEWRRTNMSLLAASIAYYSFFSMVPLLLIATSIGSIFFGNAIVTGQLTSTLNQMFGGAATGIIEAVVESSYSQRSFLTVGGAFAILLLGSSYVFVQLRNALNIIWGVKEQKSLIRFFESRLASVAMVMGTVALLLLWLVTSASISALILLSKNLTTYSPVAIELANFVLFFLATMILFAMIYKFLPSVKLTWTDVGLGALVTAFLFSAGGHAAAFYLSKIDIGSFYGVAGSIVFILVWLYISAHIFLFGVVFTKVFASRDGSHSPAEK